MDCWSAHSDLSRIMTEEIPKQEPFLRLELGDVPYKQVEMNRLQSAIFPLVAKAEEKIRSIGTCFAISNQGLCLTARHVFDDLEISDQVDKNGNKIFTEEVAAIYANTDYKGEDLPEDQLFGGFLPINTAHFIDGIDVALLHLRLPTKMENGEPIPLSIQSISLSLPSVGDQILAFGYDKGNWMLVDEGIAELEHNFKATTGKVTQVFSGGRDKVLLPFPSFECSATFLSGMSGGPVISEKGSVIGVIASSFDFEEEGPAVGYVSLIAPAMAIELIEHLEGGATKPAYLWDFAVGGAIKVDCGNTTIVKSAGGISFKFG